MLVVLLGGLAGGGLGEANAAAPHRPHSTSSTLAVRLASHHVESDLLGAMLSNGRFVSFQTTSPRRPCCTDVLIDSTTGKRTVLSTPRCNQAAMGVVGLLFSCDEATPNWFLRLFAFGTRAWRTIPISPAMITATEGCATAGPADCGAIDGVGRDWIEFDESAYHGNQDRLFQNIATGEVRQDPTTSTTIADLDSPTLARRLCRPLSTPVLARYNGYSNFFGSLSFYGTFAVADTLSNNVEAAYLEHCGTKLHHLLIRVDHTYGQLPPIAASARAVLWQSGLSLTGVFLPGLQRFTAKLPMRALGFGYCTPPTFTGCLSQIVLTARKLYVASHDGNLWAATSPSLPLVRSHR